VYRCQTVQEQVTVSLMGTEHPMSADEQSTTLHAYLEHRRQAELHDSDESQVVLSDVSSGQSSGTLAARYSGFQPATERRFVCLVLCSGSLIGTFYYEALGAPEEQAEARAKTIFNSVGISR